MRTLRAPCGALRRVLHLHVPLMEATNCGYRTWAAAILKRVRDLRGAAAEPNGSLQRGGFQTISQEAIFKNPLKPLLLLFDFPVQCEPLAIIMGFAANNM
jgi:hypothetical protein